MKLSEAYELLWEARIQSMEREGDTMKVKIKTAKGVKVPEYKTEGAAGFDIAINDTIILSGDETRYIGTGLSFEIPKGYMLQIVPRSSLPKYGLTIPNSPGIIDSDYRGEIKMILKGTSPPGCHLKLDKGTRLAQGLLVPVVQAEFEEVDELSETDRGEGGLGSTGNE